MYRPTEAAFILKPGDLVIVAEDLRLNAPLPCEASLQKRLFYPRCTKTLNTWQATVPSVNATVVLCVDAYTRRAELLEVLTTPAMEGRKHVQ